MYKAIEHVEAIKASLVNAGNGGIGADLVYHLQGLATALGDGDGLEDKVEALEEKCDELESNLEDKADCDHEHYDDCYASRDNVDELESEFRHHVHKLEDKLDGIDLEDMVDGITGASEMACNNLDSLDVLRVRLDSLQAAHLDLLAKFLELRKYRRVDK